MRLQGSIRFYSGHFIIIWPSLTWGYIGQARWAAQTFGMRAGAASKDFIVVPDVTVLARDAVKGTTNGVPPGGAIMIERSRVRTSGVRKVPVGQRDALRGQGSNVYLDGPSISGCAEGLCQYDRLAAILGGHLAPLAVQ